MDASHLEFSGLHYCLFVKVHCFVLALFATAYLVYHKLFIMSSTFLYFFICRILHLCFP